MLLHYISIDLCDSGLISGYTVWNCIAALALIVFTYEQYIALWSIEKAMIAALQRNYLINTSVLYSII